MNCTKKRNVQQLVCCVVMCCTLLQSGTDKHAEAEVTHVSKAYIFDTGEAGYTYLSWGPGKIKSDEMTDKLLEKYGSVSAMPQITVGIIDTGIDYTHSFFKDRVNSYQYDFVDGDGDAKDENKHGTHVAGIIADMTLPNVKFNAYRVANAKGEAYVDDVVAGIEQAIKDKVDIINVSLGAEIVGPEASFVKSVMDKAIANDIVIVSAVGNGNAKGIGINAQNIWPACYTEGITVASVNNEDIISKFSNYGDMVDLCAPGEGIRSSVLNGGYENEDGTSMACPFVTAAAALLLSDSPSMTYQEVTRKLEEMAIDLGDVGYDIHYGYGRVNLLDYEITPMGVDTQNEQTDIEDIGDITLSGIKNVAKGVQLEWNKVGDVDGYYVYRKTQESGYKKIGVLENSNTNTYVDQSAKNGVFYQYKVVAYSGEQRGICTNVKKIVYLTPIRCSLTSSVSKQMNVVVSQNKQASGYQIQYSTNKNFLTKKTITVKSEQIRKKKVSGLTKGKKYYVRVRCYKQEENSKYYAAWSSVKSIKIK